MDHPGSGSVSPGATITPGERPGGSAGRPLTDRSDPKPWSVVVLSVTGSAVAVAAVGCFCALVYPILKGNRARVTQGRVCEPRAHAAGKSAAFDFKLGC